ncbi:hypothetical protein B9Z55_013109 [Caenorhabditis nigoni]|uniref:Methyltransferase type 11 domain-containing protein n=2 Tax=Caenorhabditis nigoni TaxID=1611254 RepID=A0A2G5U0E5_9PELO|nr:hypothetical protein B9Z55_013109 [Caenorhabditis nigoni]
MNLLLNITSLIGRLWLWFFDRFIMYPLMKIVAPKLGVRFMNLGYWPSRKPEDAKLRVFMNDIGDLQEYEPHRAHIYLYEKAMSMHPKYPDFENLEILEVSCGQGYSLEWIERWHGPAKCLIGCDKVVTRNVNNIVYGDATNLPFADESFDFVLNVEAAHLYSDYRKFLKECARVLRSGGVFCYADVRYPRDVSLINEAANAAGFETRHIEYCTDEVVVGLNHVARKYDDLLEKAPLFVKLFSKSLRATYCAPGTEANERLRSQQKIYVAAMWVKL